MENVMRKQLLLVMIIVFFVPFIQAMKKSHGNKKDFGLEFSYFGLYRSLVLGIDDEPESEKKDTDDSEDKSNLEKNYRARCTIQ